MATYTPGIDVSRYEGEIDWKQVAAAGYRFAVIRATIGDYYTDPRFYTYWAGAKEAGLLVSAYHVIVSTKYADKQISRFLSVIDDRKSDFPLVFDIERDDNVSVAANTTCIQDCIRELGKTDVRKPIIYTAKYYWKEHVQESSDWKNYDLWVASYNTQPYLPSSWSNWKFWQYSSGGKVAGINASVDLDWFQGSYDELTAYCKSSQTSTPALTASAIYTKVLASVLNIRSGPGISYKTVGQLRLGAKLNVINLGGTNVWVRVGEGRWAACIFNGQKYMEVLPTANAGDPLQARVLVDSLNIRSGPSTTYGKLGKLNTGDVVTIGDIGGNDVWIQYELGKWCAFIYGGKTYQEVIA